MNLTNFTFIFNDTTSTPPSLFTFEQMQTLCNQAKMQIMYNDLAFAMAIIVMARGFQIYTANRTDGKYDEKTLARWNMIAGWFEFMGYVSIFVRILVSW